MKVENRPSYLRVMLFTALLASSILAASAPEAVIAPWKGNARAAYTLTMDDFCAVGARGIALHADSLARNRGLAFGFGILAGACDDKGWAAAESLMAHGHEPLNHSWAHSCPRSETWCVGPGWSGTVLDKEVDSAHKAIERHLKVRPRFYLFPFDIWQPAHFERLKALGYLGARSGSRRDINLPGFTDFFDLHFDAVHPSANRRFQVFSLDGLVDSALRAGGWALRETHGVADGSYGALHVDSLRAHFDSVRVLRDAGLLWMAPPSAVLKYRKQASAWVPALRAEGKGWHLTWNDPGLDTSLFDGELTMVLNGLPAGTALEARQGKALLRTRSKEGFLLLDARPHRGPVALSPAATAREP